MLTNAIQSEQTTKWYDIRYPSSSYTFPKDAVLQEVHFDDQFMHLELVDGRILSVPLKWVPSLFNASPQEREKYEISQDRRTIIWDPDKCAINDEVRIDDYLTIRPKKHASNGRASIVRRSKRSRPTVNRQAA